VAEGAALAHSTLWALPLLGVATLALATALPPVPVVGGLLLLRVLIDGASAGSTRGSATFDLSALVAAALIVLAIGLFARNRQALRPVLAASAAIAVWTGIAVLNDGASTVTVREGVREASILAVAVIVLNSRRRLDLAVCVRIVQVAGTIAAGVAIVQLLAHTGADVYGQIRADGTFSHPNDAAFYFGLATVASIWRFVQCGRSRLDALLAGIFAVACVSTFSFTGVGAMLVMTIAYALFGGSSRRSRLLVLAAAAALVAAFLLTSVGSERVSSEAAGGIGGTETSSSANWRLDRWNLLLHEWTKAPVVGTGLGATTTDASEDGPIDHQLPHNEYLRYLVETGVIGIAVLALGLGLLVIRFRRLGRMPGGRSAAALGGAILFGLVADAAAANTLLYTPAAYAAALLLAAAIGVQVGGGLGEREAWQ
jgi:hypothetical protein